MVIEQIIFAILCISFPAIACWLTRGVPAYLGMVLCGIGGGAFALVYDIWWAGPLTVALTWVVIKAAFTINCVMFHDHDASSS